jgi:3D (Asp-Asp-Asp) domain-containing protein
LSEKSYSLENNTLAVFSNKEDRVGDASQSKHKKIKVILTAYSSTTWQTDDTPFTTANGSTVRDGVVANNMLPFGTEIKIPELYGNKVFTVEDRMHSRKSDYQLDIWFPTLEEAQAFGVKETYIEVLEI